MFHKGSFIIEDWFGPFEGWTNGQRWNGWECPYFEFDAAIRMLNLWNNTPFDEEGPQARYDEERDAFCFRGGRLEEWDSFGAQNIEAEGKTIKVYSIGAFCWVWSND